MRRYFGQAISGLGLSGVAISRKVAVGCADLLTELGTDKLYWSRIDINVAIGPT